MKFLLCVCILVAFAVIPTFAQTPVQIEIGAYGGIPLSSTLKSCCTSGFAPIYYFTDTASYTTGVSAGVVLYDRLHVAFGAMYMPVSFRLVETICCPLATRSTPTNGTSWEFPLLGDYRWLTGAVRPFLGGGLVVHNRVSGAADQAGAPIVNGGLDFLSGSFVIRPELRYMHYSENRGPGLTVGRRATQMQILLGVTYRIPVKSHQ